MRNLLQLLLAPVGNLRWGQHPRARMSLLSVISFFGTAVMMVILIVLKHVGFKLDSPILKIVAFGGFVLVFLSGAIDNRRDRRRK